MINKFLKNKHPILSFTQTRWMYAEQLFSSPIELSRCSSALIDSLPALMYICGTAFGHPSPPPPSSWRAWKSTCILDRLVYFDLPSVACLRFGFGSKFGGWLPLSHTRQSCPRNKPSPSSLSITSSSAARASQQARV